MAGGGDVVVHIGAMFDGLKNDLNKATSEFRTFGNKLDSMSADLHKNVSGKLKGMLAGAISLAALEQVGRAFYDLAKQTADYGESINLVSQKTGMAAEDLQKLAFAAGEDQVSLEQLNKGLGFLNKNMDSAARGAGTARDAFARIGVAVTDAAGAMRPINDVLMDTADWFAKETDATAKAAVAKQLFGKAGIELIPVLEKGSAGLQELGAEAERLGIVLSSSQIAVLDEYGDQIERLGKSWQGLKMQIGSAILPAIVELSQTLTDMFVDLRESDSLERFFGSIADAVNDLAPVFETAFKAISDLMQDLGPVFSGLMSAIAPLLDGFLQAWSSLFDALAPIFNAAVTALAPIFEGLGTWFKEIGTIAANFGKIFEALAPVINTVAKIVGEALGWIAKAASYALKPIEWIASGISKLFTFGALKLPEEIQKLQDRFEALQKTLKENPKYIETLQSSYKQLGASLGLTGEEVERLGESFQKLPGESDAKQIERISIALSKLGVDPAAIKALSGAFGDASQEIVEDMQEIEAARNKALGIDEWTSAANEIKGALQAASEEISNATWQNILAGAQAAAVEMGATGKNISQELIDAFASDDPRRKEIGRQGMLGYFAGMLETEGYGKDQAAAMSDGILAILNNPGEFAGMGYNDAFAHAKALAMGLGMSESAANDAALEILRILGISQQTGQKGAEAGQSLTTTLGNSINQGNTSSVNPAVQGIVRTLSGLPTNILMEINANDYASAVIVNLVEWVSTLINTIVRLKAQASTSFQGIGSFAEGGIAWTPQLAMVAENGPELITPLSEISGASGGSSQIAGDSFSISGPVTIYANNPQEFAASLREVAQQTALRSSIG